MNAAAAPAHIVRALERLRRDGDAPLCAYLYDLDALAGHARAMRRALPPHCELYYAAKANADAPLLRALAPSMDGFEAASGGELRWLADQQPHRPLLFGGPGKLDAELTQALALPDCTVHVESLGELARLARIAASAGCVARVFLRMNIALAGIGDTRLVMGGRATPFGMDEDALPTAIALLREAPQLRLEGFHFHLMSHQCDVDVQLALVRACLAATRRWCAQYALDVRTVNAGGGFGVDYADPARSFDWPRFCEGLRRMQAEDGDGPRLRFEPGRFVSAGCGYYAMEVLDVKHNHGEWFAIGRGGTHHFRTPAAQGHDHPFFVVRGANAPVIENARVTLVGQLCTPKDVLARAQPVAALAPGDCVVFPLAGAYAWNISHQNFLMHPPPRMVYLETSDAAAQAA